MATISLTLTEKEIREAIRAYVEKQGFTPAADFSVSITTTPPDRPFDSAYTQALVSGIQWGVAK